MKKIPDRPFAKEGWLLKMETSWSQPGRLQTNLCDLIKEKLG